MIGILYFIVFIALGLAISNRVFSKEAIYIRVWTGCLMGLLGLMWCVVPFAFLFGFSIVSHILSIFFMIGLYLLARVFFKEEGCLKYRSDKIDYVLYSLIIPISGIIIYLMNGHILSPGKDGALFGGQSTFGDLPLHLGIISSIGTQTKFPPDYSIFPGTLLSYPFISDSMSSSLYLFGTPLRWAVLIPSYLMSILLIAGVFLLSFEILKHKYAAAFTTILFFFNGGFGFAYFMDKIIKDPKNFTRIFTAYYITPTNYNEHNIRWSNTICDMIIPQRTTLAGWTIVVFALWLLYRAISQKDRKYFAFAGIVTGLLPMIHTHSFLALGIIAIVWFVVYFFYRGNDFEIQYLDKNKISRVKKLKECHWMKWSSFGVLAVMTVIPGFVKDSLLEIVILALLLLIILGFIYIRKYMDKKIILEYITKWMYFAIPVIVLALPQLLFWTFKQATGENFTKLQSGWSVNQDELFPWFWIKNIGIVFIILFPAILASRRRMLSFYSGALGIFVIANIVLFQPNNYDNNKLLYIWYLFSIILFSAFIFTIYKRLEGLYGRASLIVILLVICTVSGVLTIGREAKSNNQNMMFSANAVNAADFVKANTPKDSLFVSSDQHLNPISALAGRNVFCGSGIYLFYHGLNKSDRDMLVKKMFTETQNFKKLASDNHIDYVYFSEYEKDNFKTTSDYFKNNFPLVFHQGDINIFAVSERAKSYKIAEK